MSTESPDALRAYAIGVLERAGAGAEDAAAWADLMLHASLRGVDSHGVPALLPTFVEWAGTGVGRTGSAPVVAEARGAVCVVESGEAGGARTARFAMSEAEARAREHGIGAAVARGIGYFGELAWTVEPAAQGGLVALAACNAMAFVAPAGGLEALHGTNPLAVAIPHEPNAIVADLRTNAFRMADYWHSVTTGEPLPPGVLFADGAPIRDVRELERRGWEGAVSAPAGVAGYALALVVDVLCAALAGTPIAREVAWEHERSSLGGFFLALDPTAFAPARPFAEAIARLAADAHETAPADPETPVRLPGERAAAERRRRLTEGIPVDARQWGRMEERLRSLGVEPPARPAER
jgi:LDH2 family malate/lactate/ureidoglycolate dehydrogenase